MDNKIEERFVKNFVDKRLRDRIIFELASEKKRYNAKIRFICPEEILIPNCIVLKGNKLIPKDIINEISKIFDIRQNVYIISDDFSDTSVMSFEKAFETIMCDIGVGIIVCDERTAIIKSEAVIGCGPPNIYILHKRLHGHVAGC